MAMSSSEQVQQTQHAFLVAWGRFAAAIGLIQRIRAVKLKQKAYHHAPQTKVLQFLVATLSGLKQLQEISLAAHPLDKDQAVAEAWEQPGWADYSGISRTLHALSWDEVHQLVSVLEQVSQPFLEAELRLLRAERKRLRLDGDLTGLPVSNASRSFPNAAFGHMDDEIRLGYQASVVSLEAPTYRRLWLSATHHPGDTVSCTQAEAQVLAAEARTGLHPRRRTDLLQQRIQSLVEALVPLEQRQQAQEKRLEAVQQALAEARWQVEERRRVLQDLEQAYRDRQRAERPTSRLARARKGLQAAEGRAQSREKTCDQAQQRLTKTRSRLATRQAEIARLQKRLERFAQDNAANPEPVEAEFRLDAGFGTYENIALLIEMGYQVYTKPHSHQVVRHLRRQVADQTVWTRVGDNAEMVAWSNLRLKGCPYPLNVALERFYTGKTLKHSALLHFGSDPVTQDLPAWFEQYNSRQIIEAGIKESKQVFYLHHIKVRSEPAIYLQECFVLFAANLIRWATPWLAEQTAAAENALQVGKLGIKRQVQVAAHVSAQVIRNSDGWLLKFSEQSAFAGKVLRLPAGADAPA
jgi:hypothetical protein